MLECALGPYTSGFLEDWQLPEDKVSGASSSGSAGHLWADRRWGHLDDDVVRDMAIRSCRGCCVPGPLQTPQRAELWGVILALQANDRLHRGVDNLGVVRHVGGLLDCNVGFRPAELAKDGDLIFLVGRMLWLRGLDTVRVTKVEGHADEGVVLDGRVRDQDRVGNNAADDGPDIGRRRVDHAVVDARRNLSGVCGRWYPVVLDLHWFFIAISKAVVDHDGSDGTAPCLVCWCSPQEA